VLNEAVGHSGLLHPSVLNVCVTGFKVGTHAACQLIFPKGVGGFLNYEKFTNFP
jgi:hypothetical protein